MAAATLTLVDPVTVLGNVRERIYSIGSIADTNTLTVTEFSQVLGAWIEPEVSGITHGIALSGNGNTTLTFAMSGTITAGKLFIRGM